MTGTLQDYQAIVNMDLRKTEKARRKIENCKNSKTCQLSFFSRTVTVGPIKVLDTTNSRDAEPMCDV